VRAWPAAVYREPLREILHSFKYDRETRLAPFLAALVVARLKTASGVPAAPLVVPVPLDPRRLSERGFNQAELLAREVAHALGWPLAIGLLRRTRATRPQSELTAEERRENVAGAFQARAEAAGKIIVLIDDIFTTGATADSASAALLAAGARQVYVATVAVASGHPRPQR
jgi:ComF family protein